MASLNLSTNGPSISKSYDSVVNSPPPSGAAASSPTYGQWAVFAVSAPLANAFQDSGNKESVLKVQSTGEGDLVDLIEEFSDGRIQFAYVKVKDSNTGLPKSALIAWCGEGVPERTKGYFTSHLTAVAKLLHGYHVQITARSDRDLTPEGIIQKVADASGSKYSSSTANPPPVTAATKPAIASKPVFSPTQTTGYSPLAGRTARRVDPNADADGWGNDAPPVTRTQVEKVQSAYQPTKVNMRELTSQKATPSAFSNDSSSRENTAEVVKGAYQPVGKVDIAAIRRQAKESGSMRDDRPEIVKGSYEPVGRVDIAAIRAKAQKPDSGPMPEPIAARTTGQSQEAEEPKASVAQRSAAFSAGPERLTSLPKPKVANKFGGGSTFTGTKAPLPGGIDSKPAGGIAPMASTSRTFADQGGKTPAQLWAEKKARERGASGSGSDLPPSSYTGQSPVTQQKSGGGAWESGYSGKKWGSVQTTHTGQSAGSVGRQITGDIPASVEEEEEAPASPAGGGISAIRDRFVGAAPMGAPASSGYDRPAPPPAPEPETSTKPNRGIPIPGLSQPAIAEQARTLPTPPPQARSPTPPTPEARDISPIRVAVPVSRTTVQDASEEQKSPPTAVPAQSLGRVMPESEDDEPETGPDPGRAAAQAAAVTSMGQAEAEPETVGGGSGERARAEYDYDAAEDNEVSLREGEVVTDVQKIDPDWWLVTNAQGHTGLVPSNYLEPIEDDEPAVPVQITQQAQATPLASVAASTAPAPAAAPRKASPEPAAGPQAIAQYDYEAGEDNEISFPEGATITNIEFPDDDWWHGEYKGNSGLFPAAYVELQQ